MRNRILILLLAFSWSADAQFNPFDIRLEPVVIPNLPGVQSFAVGQHNGEWLILGGRLDGLHRRQPWASFHPEDRNTSLIVINPLAGTFWTSPLSTLPLALQDQLSSTNMEFHQKDSMLYIIGGYGHSAITGSKITFAMLTAVNIPGAIEAVKKKENLSPHFRFVTDTRFAVTGGHLNKIEDSYYLVGGQKFDGDYNPMGHGTFVQVYTNAIRKFKLHDDGTLITVTHFETITDTACFHRRDYNVGPQILPDGREGILSFSGPFRTDADLPYLDITSIDDSSYISVPDFAQYFNNYHCAILPLYSDTEQEMHTVFFGGIAQHYMEGGHLVQDTDVPFVKTIARVTRDRDGKYIEYRLPVEMPGYLGASAEFMVSPELQRYDNDVVRLDEIGDDPVLAGYIFGGISSTAPNIFWINDGTQSTAHPVLYKVLISRHSTTGVHEINTQSSNGLQMQIYPNPNDGVFNIRFHVKEKKQVTLIITDEQGKAILREDITEEVLVGENRIEKRFRPFKIGGVYFVTLSNGSVVATQKILVKA